MSCDRIRGVWGRGRLIFDGVDTAVEDDVLLEVTSINAGVVEGRFLEPDSGDVLADTLTHGTCTPNGQRGQLTFTRSHDNGRVTTVYTGTVIILAGTTSVLVRQGRFTRTTRDANLIIVSVMSGDHETEKPT